MPRSRRAVAWTEAMAVVALASAVGFSVAVVGPRLMRAAAPAALAAVDSPPAHPQLAAQHSLLVELLSHAIEVLSVHGQPGSEAGLDMLVLRLADDRYPGRVNLSEVLVIRFSPLLRSVLAYTWTPEPDADDLVTEGDWNSMRRLEVLMARSDVVRAVVAQPVIRCEIIGADSPQSARPDSSAAGIRLDLTWIDESTDTREVSTIATTLRRANRSERF